MAYENLGATALLSKLLEDPGAAERFALHESPQAERAERSEYDSPGNGGATAELDALAALDETRPLALDQSCQRLLAELEAREPLRLAEDYEKLKSEVDGAILALERRRAEKSDLVVEDVEDAEPAAHTERSPHSPKSVSPPGSPAAAHASLLGTASIDDVMSEATRAMQRAADARMRMEQRLRAAQAKVAVENDPAASQAELEVRLSEERCKALRREIADLRDREAAIDRGEEVDLDALRIEADADVRRADGLMAELASMGHEVDVNGDVDISALDDDGLSKLLSNLDLVLSSADAALNDAEAALQGEAAGVEEMLAALEKDERARASEKASNLGA